MLLAAWLLGVRYIPHNKIGVVEKLWSSPGSLTEGRIIAPRARPASRPTILRGGLHFVLLPVAVPHPPQPLVVVPEGKIGYVYARDGQPLPPTQTLGRTVDCNHFQDARAFLQGGGQRGRQRAFLREGVYAINLALFVVVTEDRCTRAGARRRRAGSTPTGSSSCARSTASRRWSSARPRRRPAPAGAGRDRPDDQRDAAASPWRHDIGVVTVHDGPPIESGEIIAPEVRPSPGERDHNYFQDAEAFLALGGRRGKQLQVLTDGTFFVNRWFATVEICRRR